MPAMPSNDPRREAYEYLNLQLQGYGHVTSEMMEGQPSVDDHLVTIRSSMPHGSAAADHMTAIEQSYASCSTLLNEIEKLAVTEAERTYKLAWFGQIASAYAIRRKESPEEQSRVRSLTIQARQEEAVALSIGATARMWRSELLRHHENCVAAPTVANLESLAFELSHAKDQLQTLHKQAQALVLRIVRHASMLPY
jgi:hypothetical protein